MSAAHGIDPHRLEEALAWAEARYRRCDVCAADCRVDRTAGELGVCGLGEEAHVYKEYLHLGEEHALVPSHAVYLAGCNLRCVFCSDLAAVRHPDRYGRAVPPEDLARRIAERRRQGARNVNFVGGLPDVNLLYILRTLRHCPTDTHVVWNTNLWTTEAAMDRLDGIVGTWLADHKFGNDRCARKLAGVDGYTERLQRLLPRAAASGELFVRHLLMPGHLECCTKPVLHWLATHLPDAGVNLMTAYRPFHLAGRSTPLGRRPTDEERQRGVELLRNADLRRPMLDGRPLSATAQDGAEASGGAPTA